MKFGSVNRIDDVLRKIVETFFSRASTAVRRGYIFKFLANRLLLPKLEKKRFPKGKKMLETAQEDETFGSAGWCCSVILRDLPKLDNAQRKLAEKLFYDAIMYRLGDIKSAATSHYEWTQNKKSSGALAWIAASTAAYASVLQKLPLARSALLDSSACALFDVFFINDAD